MSSDSGVGSGPNYGRADECIEWLTSCIWRLDEVSTLKLSIDGMELIDM